MLQLSNGPRETRKSAPGTLIDLDVLRDAAWVREVRSLPARDVRAVQEGEKLYFTGYAAVFNSLSADFGGWREIIRPGAFKRALAEKQKVKHCINHNQAMLLGTTDAGTTILMEDAVGLYFRTLAAPGRSYDDDLKISLERGDVKHCSFSFRKNGEAGDRWSKAKGGGDLRELLDVDLFDVSILTIDPAYGDTSAEVAFRSMFPDGIPIELRSHIRLGGRSAASLKAIPSHSTATSDKSWDGPANEARLRNDEKASYYKQAYAWQDSEGDGTKKSDFKFPHHEVSSKGDIGAANTNGCRAIISSLNGSRSKPNIPDEDRQGVWNHAAKHLRDAGLEPAPLQSAAELAAELAAGTGCACDCENCMAGDCANCTNTTCEDEACTSAGCRMRASNDAGVCECKCDACAGGQCMECSNKSCTDKNCDSCPMALLRNGEDAGVCECQCGPCVAGDCMNCSNDECDDPMCEKNREAQNSYRENRSRSAALVTAARLAPNPRIERRAAADGLLEIYCYGDIGENCWWGGGVCVSMLMEEVGFAGEFNSIRLRINSFGGDAFEGACMGNYMRSLKKPIEVCIDGIAASAASVFAMCGDTIKMAGNAMMMIHNAATMVYGDAADMRSMADVLEAISGSLAQTYVDRTGKSMASIKALMGAETWMDAHTCVAGGFATAIEEPHGSEEERSVGMRRLISGSVAARAYKNIPKHLQIESRSQDDETENRVRRARLALAESEF